VFLFQRSGMPLKQQNFFKSKACGQIPDNPLILAGGSTSLFHAIASATGNTLMTGTNITINPANSTVFCRLIYP
jgi:hypothetical protein